MGKSILLENFLIKWLLFTGWGKIEYDNKGLSGAPYPALHSDCVVLAGFDFSDFG